MNEFIIKDDPWKRRATARMIYDNAWNTFKFGSLIFRDKDLIFDIIFNQFIPCIYLGSKSTIWRHTQEIKLVIEEYLRVPPKLYIFRKPDIKLIPIVMITQKRLNNWGGMGNLPTYLEIEKTKQKWQQQQNYREEEGFSTPIMEEVIQLRLIGTPPKNRLTGTAKHIIKETL